MKEGTSGLERLRADFSNEEKDQREKDQELYVHITPDTLRPRKLPSEQKTLAGEETVPQQPSAGKRASFTENIQLVRQFIKEMGQKISEKEQLPNQLYFIIEHYKDRSGKILSDGVEIRPGDIVAKLFMQSVPKQLANESPRDYFKKLREIFVQAMEALAQMCDPQSENYNPKYGQIRAVYGLSYFANRNLAENLGFDTEEITDPSKRLQETRNAYKIILKTKYEKLEDWEKELSSKKKFTPPRYAYISAKKLIALYGSHK